MYATGWRKYVQFCTSLGVPPLPITEFSQTHFSAHLSLSVQWKTIRSYLSAIRFFQIRAGLPDPKSTPAPKIPYILKGIHKLNPDCARPKREPITPLILRSIHALWSRGALTFDRIMLWAAFCLGYFGFMRSGEFTSGPSDPDGLCVSDITIDSHTNPQILTIHLRHSKTDQLGAGQYIHLGRTNDALCPVSAILSYMAIRPCTTNKLFVFQDGSLLTRHRLVLHLREAIAAIGLDPGAFAGHSFRIGAASTAAAAGVPESLIQQAGRWKSEAFRAYIRTKNSQMAGISSALSG